MQIDVEASNLDSYASFITTSKLVGCKVEVAAEDGKLEETIVRPEIVTLHISGETHLTTAINEFLGEHTLVMALAIITSRVCVNAQQAAKS